MKGVALLVELEEGVDVKMEDEEAGGEEVAAASTEDGMVFSACICCA